MLKKSDLTPEPIGADQTKYVNSADWFPLQLANQFNLASSELGAVPTVAFAPGVGTDIAASYEAALLLLPQSGGINNGRSGVVFLPQGHWWLGSPIWVRDPIVFRGAGKFATFIHAGRGTTANPTFVQDFAGPMVMLSGAETLYAPSYGAALVGSGRSLSISKTQGSVGTCFLLHDCNGWNRLSDLSTFSLEGWCNLSSVSVGSTLIGSCGTLYGALNNFTANTPLLVSANTSGGGHSVIVTVTTTSGSVTGTSGPVSFGSAHNISVYYDGAHVTAFVDGVNFMNAAATGNVVQNAWSGAAIGAAPLTGPESGFLNSATGLLDSWRLSSTARRSGTGSFTPPVVKYAWDSNTLWLANFDQGDPAIANSPWIILQAQNRIDLVTPVKHYARVPSTTDGGFTSYQSASEFSLLSNGITQGIGNCSGVIVHNSAYFDIKNVATFATAKYGVYANGGDDFFGQLGNISTFGGSVGMETGVGCNGLFQLGSQVQCIAGNGTISQWDTQPGADVVIPCAIRGDGSIFGNLRIEGGGFDMEGAFPNLKALITTDGSSFIECISGMVLTGTSGVALNLPVVRCYGTPTGVDQGVLKFEDCQFTADAGTPELITKDTSLSGTFKSSVTVRNCTTQQGIPWSLTAGFVVLDTQNARDNIRSLSSTDTVGSNFVGQATVTGVATTATLTFTTAEPDTLYRVTYGAVSNTGGPAAGSNRVLTVTKNVGSVVLNVEVAPGGAATVTFDIHILR